MPSPVKAKGLTARQRDLAVVALEAAAQSCQSGATLSKRQSRGLDPLAREYLLAAQAIERLPVEED